MIDYLAYYEDENFLKDLSAKEVLSLYGSVNRYFRYVVHNDIDDYAYLDWFNGFIKNNYGDIMKRRELNVVRKKLFNRRIKKMFDYDPIVFLTLTFTDKVLLNTNRKTRRRYVRDYLNSQGYLYVANIDYGEDKGREHYHALIYPDCYHSMDCRVDYSSWKYGSIDGEIVNKSGDLTKYMFKFSSHSLKNGASCDPIIYSRSVKILEELPF